VTRTLHAKAALSRAIGTREAVSACAAAIRGAFADAPLAAVVPLAGCSTSGVMTNGAFFEDGYLVGMMGLGGTALRAATARAARIQEDTGAKARALGEALRAGLGGAAPRVVVLHYDPLCHADAELFAATLEEVAGCPVVGGAAGQPWGTMVQTYQYCDGVVESHGAVALALAGSFVFEIGTTSGTLPTGLTTQVTRAEGNVLLELDGRPALDVFRELSAMARGEALTNDTNSTVVLGVERGAPAAHARAQPASITRNVWGLDEARGAVILPASIPVGTTLMFHHRSSEIVFEGTERMARALAGALRGARIRAALGCECAARSAPLLGSADMLRENVMLQGLVAPDAEWLGMLAWGELAPFDGRVTFFNFTFPLLVLAEPGG
jgi:hypothetical protein